MFILECNFKIIIVMRRKKKLHKFYFYTSFGKLLRASLKHQRIYQNIVKVATLLLSLLYDIMFTYKLLLI